jgi:predicted porin
MKKILIAATLAAAAFAASAQVTVSGKLSTWVDNTKTGSAESVTSLAADNTSNIAIKASEDLGKGLTARVVLETKILANDPTKTGTSAQLGDRQSTVGLANSFGSVDLGRNSHQVFNTIRDNDAFSTLYGSIGGDIHNTRGLRISNGVFVSATPLKNVTVSYDSSQNATGANTTSYGVTGAIGPVVASAARYTVGNDTTDVLSARGTFAKTTLLYTHSEDKGAGAKKGNTYGVKQQLTDVVTLKASYGETNTGIKAYALGGDYSLSKRTQVGVVYRNVDTVADIKQVAVGLTHRF